MAKIFSWLKPGKDPTTYCFIIDIVEGADNLKDEHIRVVALYNETSRYNLVSKRFAVEVLQFRMLETASGMEESNARKQCLSLIWACPNLGRYKQRTVFVVAPCANFDILFGAERDNPQSNVGQFEQGIKNGYLSNKLISFEEGIHQNILLRVERSEQSTTQMPTMADIKKEVAELDGNPGKRQDYERRTALNTCPTRLHQTEFLEASIARGDDLKPGLKTSKISVTPTSIQKKEGRHKRGDNKSKSSIRHIRSESGTESSDYTMESGPTSVYPVVPMMPKSSNSSWEYYMGEFTELPGLPNVPDGSTNVSKSMEAKLNIAMFDVELPEPEACQAFNSIHVHNEFQRHEVSSTTGISTEGLNMDYEPENSRATKRISACNPARDLSTNSPQPNFWPNNGSPMSIRPPNDENMNARDNWRPNEWLSRDTPPHSARQEEEPQKKKRSLKKMQQKKAHRAKTGRGRNYLYNANPCENNVDEFDKYWTWDDDAKNYYHIDEGGKTKSWYMAPP